MKENLTDYIELPKPDGSLDFFKKTKELSNLYWSETDINGSLYGFQIQHKTRWNEGLTEDEILAFEKALGLRFPKVLRNFYLSMNGLDKDGINVYGNSGQLYNYRPYYYSFPRDLALIKESIEWIYEATEVRIANLGRNDISRIFPICGHRFILIDEPNNPILSMYGNDIVFWSDSLSHLLANDIFSNIYNVSDFENKLQKPNIKFWLE